jgi:hypothetical protein
VVGASTGATDATVVGGSTGAEVDGATVVGGSTGAEDVEATVV